MAPKKGRSVVGLSYDYKRAIQVVIHEGNVPSDRYKKTIWFNKSIEAVWNADTKKVAGYKKGFMV